MNIAEFLLPGMDSDIKYALDNIVNKLDELKRIPLSEIKQKIDDINSGETRSVLGEIKSRLEDLSDIKARLESIENKLQK